MTAAMAARRPPRLGKKEVFLPSFTITLLRTPKLPPTFASFIVPLNLNKLDLRDYLYNCYGIQVLGVRSYIQQQKVQQGKPGGLGSERRRWTRPKSIKKMLVELEKPFVWPEEPKSFEPWDKETFDEAQKDQKELNESMMPEAKEKPSKERASIAEQAQALLQGRQKWKPTRKVWEDDGDATEVETDVMLPKE